MYTLRTLLELLLFAVLTGTLLVAVLVIGQWAKLADILGTAGEASDWIRLLSLTGLALLEAALPLIGLIAGGLVYGRRRGEGAILGYGALGWGPIRIYSPAFLFGLICGLAACWMAATTVPKALNQVQRVVTDLALSRTLDGTRSVALAHGGAAIREPGGALWMATVHGDGPPTLLRAARAEGRIEEDLDPGHDGLEGGRTQLDPRPSSSLAISIDAREVWIWDTRSRTHVQTARLRLNHAKLGRRLASLGPPNSLLSGQLDSRDTHHQFTWHRRLALPLMAPFWALLGAILGARFGGARAVITGAGAVTLAYWVLRTGELAARAGFGSAVVAAWAPALVLALGLALIVRRI